MSNASTAKAWLRGCPPSVLYTKIRHNYRYCAIKKWNEDFDEKLKWAQNLGYKGSENIRSLDKFIREEAENEGFNKRNHKYRGHQLANKAYQYSKSNHWIIEVGQSNNLGDYQAELSFVNRSNEHIVNNFYGPAVFKNQENHLREDILKYIGEHKNSGRDAGSVWYINAKETIELKSNSPRYRNKPEFKRDIDRRFPVIPSNDEDWKEYIEKVIKYWAET